jgi:hypothetical protein
MAFSSGAYFGSYSTVSQSLAWRGSPGCLAAMDGTVADDENDWSCRLVRLRGVAVVESPEQRDEVGAALGPGMGEIGMGQRFRLVGEQHNDVAGVAPTALANAAASQSGRRHRRSGGPSTCAAVAASESPFFPHHLSRAAMSRSKRRLARRLPFAGAARSISPAPSHLATIASRPPQAPPWPSPVQGPAPRAREAPQLFLFLCRHRNTRTTRHGTPKIQNILNQMLTYVDQPRKSCLAERTVLEEW